MDNVFDKILLDFIKKRRSIRLFTGKKIPQEDIFSIIEAGTWAPSGCNNQELRFLVLNDEKEMAEFIKFKPFFRGVSTIILVFCDMSLPLSRMYYEKASHGIQFIDTGLALSNMVLYAKSRGINSCIVNLSKYHLKENKHSFLKRVIEKIKKLIGLYCIVENSFEFYLRKFLKIPKNFKIIAGVALGYAKEYPDIKTIMHAGKRVMRKEIDYYLIQRK